MVPPGDQVFFWNCVRCFSSTSGDPVSGRASPPGRVFDGCARGVGLLPVTLVPQDHLLTVADVAHVLSVSTKTAYRLLRRGDIPTIRVGGQLRVEPAAFMTYLSENTEAAAA